MPQTYHLPYWVSCWKKKWVKSKTEKSYFKPKSNAPITDQKVTNCARLNFLVKEEEEQLKRQTKDLWNYTNE